MPDDLKGRWLDWKEAAATDADGNLIGYGTDIGPAGDLLPRRPVRGRRPAERPRRGAELFDGDWDNYFEIGAQYKAATGSR